MDTHSEHADRPAYFRGMPASHWIEASTTHDATSVVDTSDSPSVEGAAAREPSEMATVDRLDVTHRDGEG